MPNIPKTEFDDGRRSCVFEFSYDDMGRLTAATHPERFATALPLETYSYSDDGLGRRTGAATGRIIDPDTRAPADDTLVYDPDTDQLLEDGLYTYAYDDNGNRVGKTRKSDGVTTTYKYDAFDRLIYAGIDSDDPYPPTSALGSRVYYAYDWAGRLARRISGCKADLDRLGGMYQAADVCVVTRYAYDGLNLAAEYAEDGSPLVIYNHAPGSIDRPVSMQIEGAVFYFNYDERGSVSHITNGFGHIVQRYVYDSFGRIVLQQGALPNAFTYTGRHWDPVARLYHYRARAYDPDTGSFLQHDPIPAANPYPYTDNDPVNFTDPLGLKPECRDIKYATPTRVCEGKSCIGVNANFKIKMWDECDRNCGWFHDDHWNGRATCVKCERFANAKSCDELCSKYPKSPDCLEKCKEHNEAKAQDNQGDGKNDGGGASDKGDNDDVMSEDEANRIERAKRDWERKQERDQPLKDYYRNVTGNEPPPPPPNKTDEKRKEESKTESEYSCFRVKLTCGAIGAAHGYSEGTGNRALAYGGQQAITTCTELISEYCE